MKDNIDFLGLEMRILIPSIRDFGKFVDRDYKDKSFPVNRVSVAENSPYFEILRVCGVFERQKEERMEVSLGISISGGMSRREGLIFIPEVELVYGNQSVPFIVHRDVLDVESDFRTLETAHCNRINSHPEA